MDMSNWKNSNRSRTDSTEIQRGPAGLTIVFCRIDKRRIIWRRLQSFEPSPWRRACLLATIGSKLGSWLDSFSRTRRNRRLNSIHFRYSGPISSCALSLRASNSTSEDGETWSDDKSVQEEKRSNAIVRNSSAMLRSRSITSGRCSFKISFVPGRCWRP